MPPTASATGRVIETPAPGGRAVLYQPEPPLSTFVDSIWLYKTDAPPHPRERVLPSGSMQLIINLREDRLTVSDADVLRFQRALRLVSKRQEVDWAEVAASSGYFDQSHLIHDFREFSGLSPNAYLPHRGPHINHVNVPDPS